MDVAHAIDCIDLATADSSPRDGLTAPEINVEHVGEGRKFSRVGNTEVNEVRGKEGSGIGTGPPGEAVREDVEMGSDSVRHPDEAPSMFQMCDGSSHSQTDVLS